MEWVMACLIFVPFGVVLVGLLVKLA